MTTKQRTESLLKVLRSNDGINVHVDEQLNADSGTYYVDFSFSANVKWTVELNSRTKEFEVYQIVPCDPDGPVFRFSDVDSTCLFVNSLKELYCDKVQWEGK